MRPLPDWQGEYGYFEYLTPREQLNDLVHKYAQINGCKYADAWKALDLAWAAETGKTLSLFRALLQKETGKKITLPQYVLQAGLMDRVLVVAHALIGNVILRWMSERGACGTCNQTPMGGDRPEPPARPYPPPFP